MAKTWLGVLLFLVVVAAAVAIFILPVLSDTAPGGPKLSFGGSETCQLGGSLEEFNAAGFYMGEDVQNHSFSGHRAESDFKVYLSADRARSCGSGQLMNKGDGYKSGRECMVYSFSLRLEDGGHMTCNGTEILGNTQDAIRAALGQPAETYSDSDLYRYSKSGRTYNFRLYIDEAGICTSLSAYQDDPNISFY